MDTIKTTLLCISCALAMVSNGTGLYLVNNADFRFSRIKYIIQTTNDNQSVEVSPYGIRTLGILKDRPEYKHPWEIKIDKSTTLEFQGTECIRQGSVGSKVGDDGICIEAPIFQFPTSGNHLVKIYDDSSTIYQVHFRNNPSIIRLYVNWEDIPTKVTSMTSLNISIRNMVGLKHLYWAIPSTQFDRVLDMSGVESLETIVIPHPEQYTKITNSVFSGSVNLASDMNFPNVTNVMAGFCLYNNQIRNARFPNIQEFGANTFNNSHGQKEGLLVLGIGDGLNKVGMNSFYGHHLLKTIEFTTDESDWVGTWNSNPTLVSWIGTATIDPNNDQEATITLPQTYPTEYYSGSSGWMKPERIIHKYRTPNN